MSYTQQLEHDSEAARRRLAEDLDELRERITPGQLVDQLVDYVQEGSGGEFFRNLKRQTVSNPLPVTLIGAGLAWLMLGRGGNAGGPAAQAGAAAHGWEMPRRAAARPSRRLATSPIRRAIRSAMPPMPLCDRRPNSRHRPATRRRAPSTPRPSEPPAPPRPLPTRRAMQAATQPKPGATSSISRASSLTSWPASA